MRLHALMNSALLFRPMAVSDLSAVRELWDKAEGVELSEGDTAEELTRYLERNPDMSFVAMLGEEIIGAVLAGHDGRRGFMYHLAVAPDHQGRGAGRALVGRAVDALRAAGVVRVLILVRHDNSRGMEFWAKQGWETLEHAGAMGINLV
jgi:N-acetylglutamate synthase